MKKSRYTQEQLDTMENKFAEAMDIIHNINKLSLAMNEVTESQTLSGVEITPMQQKEIIGNRINVLQTELHNLIKINRVRKGVSNES